MSLFTSLNVGAQALLANQAALQTVGHNIANANTPGYSRQRVDLVTLPPAQFGFGRVGTGVAVQRVSRSIDESLQARLQDAGSSLGDLQVRQDSLARVEQVFNELKDVGISDRLAEFFRSLEELGNAPQDVSTRVEVIEQGRAVSEIIAALGGNLRSLRRELDNTLTVQVGEINAQAQELADLNRQIVESEGAGFSFDTANDLRDRRELVLRQLAERVNIKALETTQGAVNVLVGSNYLVFGKQAFTVALSEDVDEGVQTHTPFFSTTGGGLDLRSGSIKGTIDARDGLVRQFEREVNELASALIYEVNRVHSEGVGLRRFESITSVTGVNQNSAPVGGAPLATFSTVATVPASTSFRDGALVGYADDVFNGLDVVVLGGENAGLRRRIVDFEGATGTVYFDKAFPEPLAAGDRVQLTSLSHSIDNGSFDLRVVNELTGAIDVFNIEIDIDNLPAPAPPGDSTLDSVIAEINAETAAVFGPGMIVASRTSDNQLRIASTSPALRIGFGTDSSGFLAAIGLNTFFTGGDSTTMGVNPLLEKNPRFLAAARSPNPGDNTNARRLADLRNAPLLDGGSASFEEFYQGVVGQVAVQTLEAKNRFEHQSLLATQIENERERISGVNLDEEAVNLITFQRAFQASARFLSVIDELLATLINNT